MSESSTFEIFCLTAPGLEPALQSEAVALGFTDPQILTGGITFQGTWPDVWRANLHLRGASRVLARIGAFRAFHLAQLDKRARKFPWKDVLPEGVTIKVDMTCKSSKIYHAGAAAQRIERALTEEIGATIAKDAPMTLKARLEDDLCTFSIDTSGELLHKRGHKVAVGKAPMRETMAASMLQMCGYRGTEPVLDPMCGSGTFVIEAAEMAMKLAPGRSRSFAFEDLSNFDPDLWAQMKADACPVPTDLRFYGSDRNTGAIDNSTQNAERAGVAGITSFRHAAISDITPPEGPPGLVFINPPYGGRIGSKKLLFALYGAMGKVLKENFKGWRVGIVTSEKSLAKATALPFKPLQPQIAHGGIRVQLFQTGVLK